MTPLNQQRLDMIGSESLKGPQDPRAPALTPKRGWNSVAAQKKCSFGKLKPNYYIINKHIYIIIYINTLFCDNSMLTEMQSFPKSSSHVSRCAALP